MPAKDYVFDTETLGSGTVFGWGVGIFTHSEEEVECNADKVPQGLLLGCNRPKTLED
jgi:hypothetical protein